MIYQFAQREIAMVGPTTIRHIGVDWSDGHDLRADAERCAAEAEGERMAMLNIEPFPFCDSSYPAEWPSERIDSLITGIVVIADAIREANPTVRLGWWGNGLTGPFAMSLRDHREDQYGLDKWRNINSRMGRRYAGEQWRGLWDLVDVWMPQIYLSDYTAAFMDVWLPPLITLLRSYNRPCVPCIWHRYGSSGYPLMPKETMAKFCELLKQLGVRDVAWWRNSAEKIEGEAAEVIAAGLTAFGE